jgi:hypothetical protein
MVSILSSLNLKYWLRSHFLIDLISTRKRSIGFVEETHCSSRQDVYHFDELFPSFDVL